MNKEKVLKITEQIYQSSGYLEDFLSQLSLALDKEEEKEWVPKEEDEYWFIGNGGELLVTNWYDLHVDNARLAFKNVFRTREQAEARLEAIKNL